MHTNVIGLRPQIAALWLAQRAWRSALFAPLRCSSSGVEVDWGLVQVCHDRA